MAFLKKSLIALATSLLGASSSISPLVWPFPSAVIVFSGPPDIPDADTIGVAVTLTETAFRSLSTVLKTTSLAVEALLICERALEGRWIFSGGGCSAPDCAVHLAVRNATRPAKTTPTRPAPLLAESQLVWARLTRPSLSFPKTLLRASKYFVSVTSAHSDLTESYKFFWRSGPIRR